MELLIALDGLLGRREASDGAWGCMRLLELLLEVLIDEHPHHRKEAQHRVAEPFELLPLAAAALIVHVTVERRRR